MNDTLRRTLRVRLTGIDKCCTDCLIPRLNYCYMINDFRSAEILLTELNLRGLSLPTGIIINNVGNFLPKDPDEEDTD